MPSVGAAILTSIGLRAILTLITGGGWMREASGTARARVRARVRVRVGTWAGLSVCSCVVMALSVRTLIRNMAWRDGLSLRYV